MFRQQFNNFGTLEAMEISRIIDKLSDQMLKCKLLFYFHTYS